jgi:hypothetical protein
MAHTRQFDTRGKHADHPGAAGTADAAGRVPPDNPAAWSTPLHEYEYRGNPPGGVTLRAATGRAGAPMAVTVIPCDVTPCPGLNPDDGRAWLAVPRGFAPAGAELRYVFLAPGDVLILPGDPRLADPRLAEQPPVPPVPVVPVGRLRTPPPPPPAPEPPAAEPETEPATEPETEPDPEPARAAGPPPVPAVTSPAPPPPDPRAGQVHRACGYKYGTIGHKINCEEA